MLNEDQQEDVIEIEWTESKEGEVLEQNLLERGEEHNSNNSNNNSNGMNPNDKINVTIASFNVCGLINKLKCELFTEEILKYDIVCMQETKTDIIDIDTIKMFADENNYDYHVKNREKSKRKSGGLVTLLRKDLSKDITPKNCETNCMQLFSISAHSVGYEKEILLGNLYIPPINSPYSKLELFDEIELDLLNLSCMDKGLILCGDFNAHTLKEQDYVFIDDQMLEDGMDVIRIEEVLNLNCVQVKRCNKV